MELASNAVQRGDCPDAHVYLSIALIDSGYGSRAARRELDAYFSYAQSGLCSVTPLALFSLYLILKEENSAQKLAKLQMADALSAFRCFPAMATLWLSPEDNIDEQLLVDEDLEDSAVSDEEEDEVDLSLAPSPSDPEMQWNVAKENHGVVSPSMDKLMQLTGMREVKVRAVNVCKEVLLSKKRPSEIKAQVAMNFLFGKLDVFFVKLPFLTEYLILLFSRQSRNGEIERHL